MVCLLKTKHIGALTTRNNTVSFLWINISLCHSWILSMIHLLSLFSVFIIFRTWTKRPKSSLGKPSIPFTPSNILFYFIWSIVYYFEFSKTQLFFTDKGKPKSTIIIFIGRESVKEHNIWNCYMKNWIL